MSFPVAVQVYSVRRDARKNLYDTLKKIKAMGYDGVEFAGLHGHTPQEIKSMCEDIGLVPISAHVPYLEMVADPEGVLGAYAAIGCKYVAVPYLTPELRPGTEAFPGSPVLHLKDFVGQKSENMYELIGIASTATERSEEFELRPLGKGVQDFPAILEAAKEAGTKWLVIEQDNPSLDMTPMQSIKVGIDYLKTINK